MVELGKPGGGSNAYASYCLVYYYFSTWPPPSSCPDPSTVPTTGTGNNGNVVGYWYNDSVNSSFSHTASYTYDNVNRLTGATATGNATYSQIYAYGNPYGDGSNGQYGNMVCTTGCTPANWTLDPGSNHLTPTSSYTYDAAGNLTKDSSNPTVHTYQWDAEGRVGSVDSGSTWTFTYNAVGDRVQWAYPGGANQQMFDPNGGWLGIAGALDVLRWGDGAYAWYTGTETYFNHINNISSTTVLTNHSGAAALDILYYPWGQMPPWHLWGGGGANYAELPYQDGNTDTNITMFRFHSPAVGRWLSPDPVGGDITNPQSLNRYAYVLNNPTSLTDPMGLGGGQCPPGTLNLTCNPQEASQSNLCSALSIFCSNGVTSTNLGGSFEFSGWQTMTYGFQNGDPFTGDPEPVTFNMLSWSTDLGGIPGSPSTCTAAASAFVSANAASANQIAQSTGVSASNLLGLSALESNFGSSNLATKYNNYFGLTKGPAFQGTTGSHTTPDGRVFGVYPSPGFSTSGMSFGQSFQGLRVKGVTDPETFANMLTMPAKAFNSEPGYASKLVFKIGQVSKCP